MSIDQLESSAYYGAPRQLFLFTMGNKSWGYCPSESVHTYLSVPYQPEVIEMDAIAQSLSEGSPTINITIHSGAEICQQFIAYQPTMPMRVRVYRYHEWDTDSEYAVELIGEVVSAAFDESERTCTLLVRMMASYIERNVPWPVYQKQCNRAVYSAGCGVNKEAYKVETDIQTVLGDELRDPVFATYPDGWFRVGYVVTSQGETRFIVWHEGDTLILQTPLLDLNNGDPLIVYPGCDLLRTTCKNKFDNLNRWLGFGWVPSKNPFTDNVFGTGGSGGSSGSNTDYRKAINPAGWNGSWGMF